MVITNWNNFKVRSNSKPHLLHRARAHVRVRWVYVPVSLSVYLCLSLWQLIVECCGLFAPPPLSIAMPSRARRSATTCINSTRLTPPFGCSSFCRGSRGHFCSGRPLLRAAAPTENLAPEPLHVSCVCACVLLCASVSFYVCLVLVCLSLFGTALLHCLCVMHTSATHNTKLEGLCGACWDQLKLCCFFFQSTSIEVQEKASTCVYVCMCVHVCLCHCTALVRLDFSVCTLHASKGRTRGSTKKENGIIVYGAANAATFAALGCETTAATQS